MRLIVMGTGPFAVPMFEAILAAGHDVPVVVTRPTRPTRGRKKPPPNPMREAAEPLGMDIWAPDSINDPEVVQQLGEVGADLMVVCDYGQILSRDTLATTRLGGINLHGSLLPKYRGAAPVQWAIINGDSHSGVTVIHMTPKLDGGPTLVQVDTPIEAHETAETLEVRLSQLGVPAVLEAIELLASWDGKSTLGAIQDSQEVTKAPRLTKQHGAICWSDSALDVINRHRGVQPWPGSFTLWDRGKQPLRLLVKEMVLAEQHDSGEPGEVIAAEDERLIVACGDGCVAFHQIQPAGKRLLTAGEFLRGYQIQPGIRFQSS